MFSKLKRKIITWLDKDGEPIERPSASPYNVADIMGCYRNGSYDNNFPNITRIAEAFAEVSPFAVDANGDRLASQPHLLEVLNNPNKEMSGTDFAETLMVMLLVHPVVHLLCWHNERGELVAGGRATPENIAGFTFMEGVGVSTINGETTYFYNGNTYGANEVIALSLNVNPYNLLSGYSPSMAAKKWATVDDYIADYQVGWFANGGVPAGEFVVTAPTAEEFNKIVDTMQASHRGASKANNPMYVHRPTSAIDGKPMAAQVEWVPFAQATEKGTLQSIFDQANKKIDMDFGVPEEVKGYLQNSNYASAEVASYVFSRYVIYPKLRKVYSKLTHELNRVTGGLGFALDFDYEIPALTDMRKVQAETLQIMINSGFTVESSVEALQLPSSFKKLIKDDTSLENTVKNTEEALPANEKTVKAKGIDIQSDDIWREPLSPELVSTLSSYFNKIIDKAVELFRQYPDDKSRAISELRRWLVESKLADSTAKTLSSVLIYLIIQEANKVSPEFAERTGIADVDVNLTDEEYENITGRIEDLMEKFGEETISDIDKSTDNSMDEDSLIIAIASLRSSDAYRIERWVASEQHYAEGEGMLLAAGRASEQSGLRAVKTWKINPASPDICQFCVRMHGETVDVDKPFSNGQMVPHYHPHCYCTVEFSFLPRQKSVKITCPSCGRYMMESTGGTVKNVICANSKCKKHYDFEIKGGEVKATERE